jgi:hypothetical protein
VGKKIRFLFDEGGLLGIANLFIIAASVLVIPNKPQTDTI